MKRRTKITLYRDEHGRFTPAPAEAVTDLSADVMDRIHRRSCRRFSIRRIAGYCFAVMGTFSIGFLIGLFFHVLQHLSDMVNQ